MTTPSTQNLNIIQGGDYLTEDQMRACMNDIMEGLWSNDDITAFLLGLAERGESVEEITGAAKVMREKALAIKAPEGALDCCGTGGDAKGTYNISTAVALVCAACDIPMAKHGNRSASSKSGAADVLEALGVELSIPKNKIEEALDLYNYAFLMAPRHHSAMKHVMPVRKKLGVRTIFNILGPLANPAGTKYQLLGVFDKEFVLPMAQVLDKLGTHSAWVVHGSDGLDEITTTGETYVAKLKDGKIKEDILTPEDFGLKRAALQDITGGTPEENAKALRGVLEGKPSAYRDIVLANAAAAIVVAGKEKTLEDAVWCAAHALDNGKALEVLEAYITFTKDNAEG